MSSDRRFLCVSVEIFIMWILEKKMEASRGGPTGTGGKQ